MPPQFDRAERLGEFIPQDLADSFCQHLSRTIKKERTRKSYASSVIKTLKYGRNLGPINRRADLALLPERPQVNFPWRGFNHCAW